MWYMRLTVGQQSRRHSIVGRRMHTVIAGSRKMSAMAMTITTTLSSRCWWWMRRGRDLAIVAVGVGDVSEHSNIIKFCVMETKRHRFPSLLSNLNFTYKWVTKMKLQLSMDKHTLHAIPWQRIVQQIPCNNPMNERLLHINHMKKNTKTKSH